MTPLSSLALAYVLGALIWSAIAACFFAWRDNEEAMHAYPVFTHEHKGLRR